MKDKNIMGNANKATLPNGEKLSDKIQRNKVNQGVNDLNKGSFNAADSSNSTDGTVSTNGSNKNNKNEDNKEKQQSNGKTSSGLPDVKGMGTEAAKEALKTAAGTVPYTSWIPKGIRDKIIDKFMDSDAGQAMVEKAFREVKTKLILAIVGIIAGLLMSLFMLCAVVTLVMAPVALIGDMLEDTGNFFSSLGHWFSGDGWCATDAECQADAEKKYYEKLEKAIDNYKGSCDINEDLITATIFYGQMVAEENPSSNISEENDIDEDRFSENESNNRYFDYLDVSESGSPTAESKINKLVSVYLKGEEDDVSGDEVIQINTCARSANAYRNYLINTYIKNNYPSAITKERTIEDIADDILRMGGIDVNGGNTACAQSCTYTIGDKSVSKLKVQLTDEDGNNIVGQEPIYFEDYILGVVYGEVGVDADPEVWKAHAIAVRSSILASATDGNIKFVEDDEETGTLYIANTSSTHIYCDPDDGCAETNDGVIISGTTGSNINSEAEFKPKYGLDSNSNLGQVISEVIGRLAVDSSENIINTTYDNTTIESWKTKAIEGKSYTQILGETYTNLASISEGDCSALCNFAAGPFTSWKQNTPSWKDIIIVGNSTIENIGCLTTSVSIQVARSGVTTPLGEDFNPGTLVSQYRDRLYSSKGNWQWHQLQTIIPDFVYSPEGNRGGLLSFSNSAVASTIVGQINDGCYLVAEVKSHLGGKNQHWVAIDTVQGDEVYILDPKSNCETISQCPKYKISQSICYKVKK